MKYIKYSSNFDTFEPALRELLSIVPDLRDYVGNAINKDQMIRNLLDLFKEEIPSLTSDKDQMELVLKPGELVFTADNGMVLMINETVDKEYKMIIEYKFTFINYNTLNTRRLKRIQKGFKENGWREEDNIDRDSNKEEVVKEENIETKEDNDVQYVPNKDTKDYSSYSLLPTFIQDDEEPPKQEEKSTSLDSQLTLNIGGHAKFVRVDRLKRNAGKYAALVKDPLDPIDIANRYSTLTDFYRSSDFRENMDYWYSENQPTQALQEVESIILSNSPNIDSIQEQTEPNIEVQQVDSRNIPSRLGPESLRRNSGKYAEYIKPTEEDEATSTYEESIQEELEVEYIESNDSTTIDEEVQEIDARKPFPRRRALRQTILPNGSPTTETQHIEPSSRQGLEELDYKYFNIRPIDHTNVMVTFEGREMPINLDEKIDGIYRDRANKKFVIDYALYDYSTYRVYKLPDNYEPDNATYVEATDKMIQHQQIPDEAFVPQSTIMKNAEINIDAIQEEAIKRERFKEKLTGVKSNLQWNRERQQSPMTIPQGGNVLRKGKAFVIDSPQRSNNNQQQTQSVRIINEDSIY